MTRQFENKRHPSPYLECGGLRNGVCYGWKVDLILNIELKPRRPVIIDATTGFLAYAWMIPLLYLLLPNDHANAGLTSKLLIGLTLAAMIALFLPANRPAFHLTRAALLAWLISA